MAAATIHPSAIVDPGASIGAGSRVWHFVHVCAGAVIGRDCSLGQNVFVGNRIFLSAVERSGGDRVFGHESFEVDAPDGSGTSMLSFSDAFLDQTLDVGDLPHDATVRSPASGDTLTVHALDTSSIWLLSLVVGGEDYDGSEPLSLAVGEQLLVQLVAKDRSMVPIPGNPPAPPSWQIHGTSVAEGSANSRGTWFRGEAAGQSTVLFEWGDAQAAVTIDVTP